MTQIPNLFPHFLKGTRGIFYKFAFGHCPSIWLRVVSLSNHLLFVDWCLEFFQSWTQLYLDSHYYFFIILMGHNINLI
jgi:hypothetical protein